MEKPIQNIISFDVGTRNLGLCEISLEPSFAIQKWQLFNFCKEVKTTIPCNFMQKNKKKCKSIACCHTPNENPQYFCKKHQKEQKKWFSEHPKEHNKSNLTKKTKEELENIRKELHLQTLQQIPNPISKKSDFISEILTLYQQNTLIQIENTKENARHIPILEIAKRMTEQLGKIQFAENAVVLIENQITDKMKMIQALLIEYFLLQYPNTNVICYSSTNKLKAFDKKFDEIEKGHTKNKINGIYYCAKIMEANKSLFGDGGEWKNKVNFNEILNGKKQSKKNNTQNKFNHFF